MTVFLCILSILLFVAAVSGWAVAYIARMLEQQMERAYNLEIATIKKVGKWNEDRVAELENETRQLAEQIIAAGTIVRHAMPIPPPEPYQEWSSDDTGLIRERLDPRELG